jgi:hypothetical protein
VNFAWAEPFHIIRLERGGDILQIPPGTFHRSVSDLDGSVVLNQSVRTAHATIAGEFRVYNSADIPRLWQITSNLVPPVTQVGKFFPKSGLNQH